MFYACVRKERERERDRGVGLCCPASEGINRYSFLA
jgi:hypothetical protein